MEKKFATIVMGLISVYQGTLKELKEIHEKLEKLVGNKTSSIEEIVDKIKELEKDEAADLLSTVLQHQFLVRYLTVTDNLLSMPSNVELSDEEFESFSLSYQQMLENIENRK